jgi:pre-mRNA-processing factor 6
LFKDSPYDQDDEEADQIFEAIDDFMDSRRKRRREAHLLERMKKYRVERPKISDQFSDLKMKLKAEMTDDMWNNIPEASDTSHKNRQRQAEIFTPMPDSILAEAAQGGSVVNGLTSQQQKYGGFQTPIGGAGGFRTPMSGLSTPMGGGFRTPMGGGGAQSSLTNLSDARGTVLSLKLDKMSDSVTGQTVVDPKGYLTDLNSMKINSDAEVGDIKKARLLLKSVTTTNPKHGPGWIAAARLEEVAGKLVQARAVIKKGCEAAAENEDVWLEAARLQTPENAKTILASAVHHIPHSVKIWLKACDLENEDDNKRRVLRRALEFVPKSVKLWKTAIEMEDEENAKIMLSRAVECVPHSVDMWLALARLETYANAKKVLNSAREAVPAEPLIWITAAKLEEAHGNGHMVDKIIEKAVKSLSNFQVVIDREQWLKEAENAEQAGAKLTAGAIVRNCISLGVELEDRKRTWGDDADSAVSHGAVVTARAIYAHALTVFPAKKSIWLRAADLEKKHGTAQSLEQMLKKAVTYCPQAEILWLMAAKEAWLSGDVDSARTILTEAFAANPDSEQVWLAAYKLELENGEFERARMLLSKARDGAPTQRVWMKSAMLEREAGDREAEGQLLVEATKRYPSFDKLYMMAGQRADALGNVAEARQNYQAGLRRCPTSIPLWKLASALEEKSISVTKARSVLELARLKNPKSPELWVFAVRLEVRHNNAKLAQALMAKALQECPDSGRVWAEEISLAPRAEQKSKSVAALKKCDNDPQVICAVATLFWNDRKYPKARKWFNRAVTLDPDFGDVWAAYYKFELEHGDEEQQESVLKRCVAAEPAHGEKWCVLSKQSSKLSVEQKLKQLAT